jgi:hypothetical protein
MAIPLPDIPGDIIYLFLGLLGVCILCFLVWLVWFRIPNDLQGRWLIRISEGQGGWLHQGDNKIDPKRNDQGNAAGVVTNGPAIKPIICFKGYHCEKNDAGEYIVVPDVDKKQDKKDSPAGYALLWPILFVWHYLSALTKKLFYGIFWLGPLYVYGAGTNKWEEWVEERGKKVLRTFDRREFGFRLKVTNFGFETEAAEAKNKVPYKIKGEAFWRIENIDRATRMIDDSNYKAAALLTGEIVAWVSKEPIYHIERDRKGKIVAVGAEPSETLKEKLVVHLSREGGAVERIRKEYGFLISEIVILDIEPMGEFSELLAAEAKAELKGQADVRAEEFEMAVQNIRREYTEAWSDLYRRKPETFVQFAARGIEKHGPPSIFGIEGMVRGSTADGDIGRLLQLIAPKLSAEEIDKVIPQIMELLKKKSK